MKTVRIVTQNPVYGYKGRLFERANNLGHVIDHEVEDDVANELLSQEYSPFREVDAAGNTIPSELDKATAEKVAEDEAARTTVVSQTPASTPPEEPKAKKTIKIESKPKTDDTLSADNEPTDTEDAVEV